MPILISVGGGRAMPQVVSALLLSSTLFIAGSVVYAQGSDRMGFTGSSNSDAGYSSPSPAFTEPAMNSQAVGGTAGRTTDTTWQDVNFQATPGVITSAPVGQTQRTNKQPGGFNLPVTEVGSQAVAGGYVRAACGKTFSGGFKSNGTASVLSRIFGLPQTATSCVDLNVTGQ